MSRQATYVQVGEVIDWANGTGADVSVGDVVVIGERIGVALVDIASGKSGALKVTGIFEMPAINTAAFSVGDQVYWDDTESKLTNDPNGNTPAGWITETKLLAGTTARIMLTETRAEVGEIGDTSDLKTDEQSTLVGAINEVNTNADEVLSYLRNHVQTGCLVGVPTTGSTHGDGGAFDFNVDIAPGLVVINGVFKEFAAQADFDLANGAESPIGDADTDIIYVIVVAEADGTVTMSAVAGAAATAEEVAAPTDAQITAAVGHENWFRIGTSQFHRSGAAACTQTYSNDERPYVPTAS